MATLAEDNAWALAAGRCRRPTEEGPDPRRCLRAAYAVIHIPLSGQEALLPVCRGCLAELLAGYSNLMYEVL